MTSSSCVKVVELTSKLPEVGPFRTVTIIEELPLLLPSFTLSVNLYEPPGDKTFAFKTFEETDLSLALYSSNELANSDVSERSIYRYSANDKVRMNFVVKSIVRAQIVLAHGEETKQRSCRRFSGDVTMVCKRDASFD